MELLNAQIPSSPQIFSRAPLTAPRFSITAWNKENPLSFNVTISKFALKSPFFTFLPLTKRRNFHVSAHFGRHSTRRNSLRKKLTENPQVRESPISIDTQNPSHSFGGAEDFRSNSVDDSVKESNVNYGDGDYVVETRMLQESKSELSGGSILFDKLDSWVNQYKKDVEFWGVGSGPIFTVFQDMDGNVERVSIDENEISRRCGQHFMDLMEVNSKISHAKFLARRIESGNYVFPKNSSVAKFVVSGGKSSFLNEIRSITLQPDLFPKLSRVGIVLLCGSFVFWAAKRLLTVREDGVEVTRLKGRVEVIQQSPELPTLSTKRPQLDRQELMNSISKVKVSEDRLALRDSFSYQTTESVDFQTKIQEIRKMARRAREIEAVNPSIVDMDGEENRAADEEISNEEEVVKQPGKEGLIIQINLSNGESKEEGPAGIMKPKSLEGPKTDDILLFSEAASVDNRDMQATSSIEVLDVKKTTSQDLKDNETSSCTLDSITANQPSDTMSSQLSPSEKSHIRTKPRVIRSVKEAREYLSEKCSKQGPIQEPQLRSMQEGGTDLRPPIDKGLVSSSLQRLDMDKKVSKPSLSGVTSDIAPAANASEHSTLEKRESVLTKIEDLEDVEEGCGVRVTQTPNCGGNGGNKELGPSVNKENWMEKNFQEFEPIVKKIGVGFRDNYMVAREKVDQELNESSDMTQLSFNDDDGELEWMKDDGLREIVFQVRENELAGRDPFYSMDAEDKLAFFKGLERKVEKENEKLLKVHEWVHSNIENVDYGTDGVSLYDPVEKIIPRWKGPTIDRDPEFLNNFLNQRKAFAAGNAGVPYPVKKDEQESLQKSEESPSKENIATSSVFYNPEMKFHDGASKNSKTIIESSDGSVKAGKKSGKEYWQHTKKWSRGFLQVYNEESDPEVKSIMKDMGKDLDRWITEKEIEEAADLMAKLPQRKKEFIEKRINKLKREMELFGPQAVVSKYREYAEENQEDYLWWLDLPCVLCIELYTNENGDQKIGFYSLEMAPDLELNPKQYHVIAFEDPGDCKNLCYIIQAHMDMLRSGHAFVVARPSKDAFREAKANGFSVTVIRKGELELNVDQTLEEVEEKITEIGSKIYHDKIMQERSVDISSLMKGVFGASKPTRTRRKRLKRLLKKPTKHERH